MNSFLYPTQQLTTVYFLEYQIKLYFVFEKFDQLDDIWMALAMMERFDFLKHTCSCVTGNFVDNFNGILQIGIQRPTSLN